MTVSTGAARPSGKSTREGVAVELADLADAWQRSKWGDMIDWTRLRCFLDFLQLHPESVDAATREPPRFSGCALLDNLLAGMAEKLCDDAQLPRPAWTSGVARLDSPWVTPGTPRVQAIAHAETPPQLTARGVTLAQSSLWRDRTHADR